MAKDFKLVTQFNGYRNKRDVTNIGATYMVEGSQNVLINDGEKIATRKGYTQDGTVQAGTDRVEGSYEWNNNLGNEIPLKSFGTTLQYRYSGEWYDLYTTLNSAVVRFATYWDFTEAQEVLLFVDGSSNMFMWSGGIATFASATATTLTLEGGGTWAASGFLTAGTRSVILGGIEYTYTGGETTDTLTGLTTDPTVGGHSVGDVIHQSVRVTATTPSSAGSNDLIAVLDNQVWVGDESRLDIYVSANNDYTDYTFSSPRTPGEGALLNLDSAPRTFVVQENVMYIGGTKDDWYASSLELSSDLLNETLAIKRLKTGPGQGPIADGYVGKAKNNVIFISNEPTMDTLGRQENINTPQSVPLSDPIKKEFNALDFTSEQGHIKFYKSQVFLTVPANERLYIYDFERGYWQPPQVLPVGRLAIIDGELYGHSTDSPNTYKLFDSQQDNGEAISAVAVMSYRHYGLRAWQKNFDEWYTEGYISPNTEVTLELSFDYQGFNGDRQHVISGTNDDILFQAAGTGGLGHAPLGHQPLGGLTSYPDDFAKFRVIHTGPKTNFYEVQAQYSSDGIDQEWEILGIGGNVVRAKGDNIYIKI